MPRTGKEDEIVLLQMIHDAATMIEGAVKGIRGITRTEGEAFVALARRVVKARTDAGNATQPTTAKEQAASEMLRALMDLRRFCAPSAEPTTKASRVAVWNAALLAIEAAEAAGITPPTNSEKE